MQCTYTNTHNVMCIICVFMYVSCIHIYKCEFICTYFFNLISLKKRQKHQNINISHGTPNILFPASKIIIWNKYLNIWNYLFVYLCHSHIKIMLLNILSLNILNVSNGIESRRRKLIIVHLKIQTEKKRIRNALMMKNEDYFYLPLHTQN